MYPLHNVAAFNFGPDTYVLDVHRTDAGLVSISSDQRLALLDPVQLPRGPVRAVAAEHGNVSTLRVYDPLGLVCTAGEDGSVAVWDLRARGGRVAQFHASDKPILSMACDFSTTTIAIGTELQNHTASLLLYDVRAAAPSPKAHYQDVHSDDITALAFNPSAPHVLLSGSTDGLVNVYDTTVADEDDVTVQTLNHNASIHHAAWLARCEVLALSHDERFALYDVAEERTTGDAALDFGDVRRLLGCRYVADVAPKRDGSGAVVGAGSQDDQMFTLTFLAKNGESWALDHDNAVGLPGAHGEEIVRSFCFFDEDLTVFTAGEDGNIKAWIPGDI